MDNTNMNNQITVKENVIAGIVGAFLFSLVGGILWYLLYQIGFLAGISGLVGVVCALKGYSLFAKKESRKGVIISVIMAVLVMLIAWYLCLSTDVYRAYQEWYSAGEVDFTLTFSESVRSAYYFLTIPEVAKSYIIDLGMGLLLCAVGCGRDVVSAFKKVSPVQNNVQEETAPTDEIVNDTEN